MSRQKRDKNRPYLVLAPVVIVLTLVLTAGSTSASLHPVDYFGTESGSGDRGGEFNLPKGIAVNQSGAGPASEGDIYVVDTGGFNTPSKRANRIQRFGRDDNGTPADLSDDSFFFISAWGADVVKAGGSGDQGDAADAKYEICTVAAQCKQGVASGGNGTPAGNGAFDFPQGIAVDQDTGNVFVADSGNNRLNVYNGVGNFLRSFGFDVVAFGPGQVVAPDEMQELTVKATGGKFSLAFEDGATGGRGKGRTAKGSKEITEVTTTNGSFVVGQTFTALALGQSLFPPGTAVTAVGPATLTLSQPALETRSPTFTEFFGDDLPSDVSASELEAELNALPSIGGAGGSVSVSGGPGDSGGSSPYTIEFGGSLEGEDVPLIDASGNGLSIDSGTPAATVAETAKGGAFEVCVAADGDVCKAARAGDAKGELGGIGEIGAAVSQPDGDAGAGTLFLADIENRRVNAYDLAGNSLGSIGSAAVFGAASPTAVAVDSRGIVYVNSRIGEDDRIERYDSTGVNGGGVGFLAPIPLGVDEVQRVTISATAGQYRLSFGGDTTADLSFNAATNTIKAALIALPSIGDGDVQVFTVGFEPNSYRIRFTGELGIQDVAQVTASNGTVPLSGGSGASVETLAPGKSGLLPGRSNGLTVDADLDGGGGEVDILHVFRNQTRDQQFGPVNAPGLALPPSSYDVLHGSSSEGIQSSGGIAVDETTGRFYVTGAGLSTAGKPAPFEGHGVYVFGEVGGEASATLDSVSDVTSTAATIHATITPNGAPTVSYRLEYSQDGISWTATPSTTVGTQKSPQAVSPVLNPPAGLEPNTAYQVRLVATRIFSPPIVTPPLAFKTLNAPPIVETVGAPIRTTTTAQLGGRVDPRGSAATYRFEYGSAGPCSANPCAQTPSRPAGAVNFTELVSETLTGLEPGATYHYRIVADNGHSSGPSFGEDMTVATPDSEAPLSHGHFPGPPGSDRAYEQINTPDTGGNPIEGAAAISDDGSRALWELGGGTPLSETGSFNQFYAERTQQGWQTVKIYPAREELPGTNWFTPMGRSDLSTFTTFNFSNLGEGMAAFRLSPEAPALKLHEASSAQFAGFVAGSDDGSTVLIKMRGAPDPAYPKAAVDNLYDVGTGSPHLVSLLPGDIVPACGVGGSDAYSLPTNNPARTNRWISSDGDLVFFPSKGNVCDSEAQLYVRDLIAADTKAISTPQISGALCGAAFVKSIPGAVFFWTKSRLVDSDSAPSDCKGDGDGDVYRYDLDDGALDCVTCVVPGLDADVAVNLQSPATGVQRIAVADDGSRVYFVSLNRLLPGARTPGIYRVDVQSGDLAYVAHVLDFNADVVAWGNALSADGSVLVFRSDEPTLNPLGGSDNEGSDQYYRYDDEDRSLVCVSCPLDGSPPRGAVPETFSGGAAPNATPLSSDGEIFAFSTPTSLIDSDQNTAGTGLDPGKGSDVYEWRDGRLLLVTDGITVWSGDSASPRVKGITPSGRDILFTAAAQLTPDALDDYLRLYDARIGGGIEFPKPPPPCPLEVCQGTPKGAPAEVAPGTGAFVGSGNPPQPTAIRCGKGKRKVRRGGKPRCIKKRHSRNRERSVRR